VSCFTMMTNTILIKDLSFKIKVANARLYSLELDYDVPPSFILSRFFRILLHAKFGVAINGTYQDDPNGNLYQFNPYIYARWTNFPWNKYLATTGMMGEGVSYSSGIPLREARNTEKAANARRFLNYVVFEATFALPKYPQYQLVYRIHHRSGVFGLFTSGIVGSSAIGFGVRIKF